MCGLLQVYISMYSEFIASRGTVCASPFFLTLFIGMHYYDQDTAHTRSVATKANARVMKTTFFFAVLLARLTNVKLNIH
jgi:hypothetical protein